MQIVNRIKNNFPKDRTTQIILGGMVLLALVGAYFGYGLLRQFVATNETFSLPGDPVMSKEDAKGEEEVGSTPKPTDIPAALLPTPEPWDGVSRVNLLVMGLDYRDWEANETPRTDTMIVFTLDPLNQTAASDMGMLLADIYECAHGGGTLRAVFPDQIQPAECQEMLDLLSQDRLGYLLQAGVPDGTRVAHKHGWTESPFDSLGDAGIVFSPAGDYVLCIFLWNSREMIWEPTSDLVADLSRAVYNYFNPPQ